MTGSSAVLRRKVAEQVGRAECAAWQTAVAASLAAALLAPAAAGAAEVAASDTSGATLSEVIVTATRREEKLNEVPVSTTVMAADQLQALNMSGMDIRQLSAAVPSLQVESSNGRTFPRFYIRGYGNTDFTTFASQPVSLVYDDIVQENAILKGFPIFDQADVEVLRGPQGTLFGRNSPAGVVKLESAKPQLGQFSGSVSVSDGTYNTGNVQAVLNLPLGERTAMRISSQYQHRDNWVDDPVNNTHTMGYDDWATRVQLLYQPDDTFSALFNVHGRTLDGAGIIFRANIIQPGSEGALVPGFDPSKWYADGYVGQTYSMAGGNVHLTWKLPSLTFKSITGYESILHYNTIGDIDGGYGNGNVFCVFNPGGCTAADASGPGYIPFPVETGGGIKNHYQLSQEFQVFSTGSGPLQAQGGIFLFKERTQDISHNYAPQLPLVELDTTSALQTNDAAAIYGSVEWAATSDLKLRAGARFTHDHKDFSVPIASAPLPPPAVAIATANKFNWDLSATYQIDPGVDWYARVATGFRAPSFGAPTPATANSPAVPIQVAVSEDNISYETGIKADLFERKARVAFDVYYYDVSHQQLTAVGGASNVTQLVNAAHTKGRGAELEFTANVTSNLTFSLSGSYNYTEIQDPNLVIAPCFNWSFAIPAAACTSLSPPAPGGVYVNGDPLPQAPKVIADASARYGIPLGSGEAYAFTDWSYRGKMDLFLDREREFTAPPLVLGGLRLGYEWAEKKYDVAVFCRNCTNAIKLVYGINFENFTGIINEPRIIGAQFSAKF
ncbi:MAG: TonB-dependent receptor [Proteobacteria bacterium]|nr:TonB-dependent receptor [Pseudomonadota bacterium]